MSRAEVKEMIDEVDDNKDGRLDYREVSKQGPCQMKDVLHTSQGKAS